MVTPEEIEFQLGLYALFIKLAQGYILELFVDLGNATVEEFPADEESRGGSGEAERYPDWNPQR